MESDSNVNSERLNGMFNEWIDKGASNHVTGDISCLTDVVDIFARPVGLPDGRCPMATNEGVTRLNEFITPNNVLYVPSLNYSLISVSQLINDHNCMLQFTLSTCGVHDQGSKTTIGMDR